MKNHFSSKGLLLALVLTVVGMLKGYSAAHISMSTTNCTVTATYIQFDVTITNDGDAALTLSCGPAMLRARIREDNWAASRLSHHFSERRVFR